MAVAPISTARLAARTMPAPSGRWAPIRGSSGGTAPSYDATMPGDRHAPVPAPVPAAWAPDEPAFEAHVLRAFIRDGRLASIPARERKKLVVYRYLVDQVLPDPDEIVDERDVNMRLALWNPDVATLRRAFVEHGFVSREGMRYRRAVPPRPGDHRAR